jgi:hypothetical protein
LEHTIEEDTIRYRDHLAGGKGKIAVLGYKHFMLENRNISINMGTEALVAS